MTFQVRIQNLGKLADATVRVGDLTVLAGANNTGKSYFSKALYSTLKAVNLNHVRVVLFSAMEGVMEYLAQDIDEHFPTQYGEHGKSVRIAREKFAQSLSSAAKIVQSPAPLEFKAADAFAYSSDAPRPDLVEIADQLGAAFAEFKASAKQYMEGKTEDKIKDAVYFLAQAEERIEQFRRTCGMSWDDFVSVGINLEMRAMNRNFQVGKIGDLRGNSSEPIQIEIPDVANLHFAGAGGGHIISKDGFRTLQRYSRVIYLDSPAFWRAQIALKKGRYDRADSVGNGREWLDGVPKYFDDLEDLLEKGNLSGDVAFPKVVECLTGEKGIGGRVVRDDFGQLFFYEGEKRFPVSAISMGVTNLGILAMLIEKKLVDKGTFLFIDEPESNLHPEWQVAMTEALWELARGGVNVVIATHSVDILKRLEIYAKEKDTKEDAANLIAVNHFQRDGTVQSGGVEKIRDIKRDLSAPFFKLYKRGLS